MKRRIKFLFLSIVGILLCIVSIKAQLRVSGKVATTTGKNVQNALVRFVNTTDTSFQISALTNSSGDYSLIITGIPINKKHQQDFQLYQNYPNPFSERTNIQYSVQKSSPISIDIYDILGRKIRKFKADVPSPGNYHITWDGRNEALQKVAYGIYFCKITGKEGTQTKKMIFLSQTGTEIPLHGFVPKTIESKLSISPTLQKIEQIYALNLSNTDNTSPRILDMQQSNINIRSDTTINFHPRETLSNDAYITDIAFSDSLNGWITTWTPGGIYKTEDGGKTWFGQKTDFAPITNDLYAVSAINKDTLFIVGKKGILLHTIDGGNTWLFQNSDTTFNLGDVFFKNENEGWIVGGTIPTLGKKSNVILHTTNAGVNWEISYSSEEGSLSSVHFVGPRGWAVGNQSFDNFGPPLLFQTTDNGSSWFINPTLYLVGGYLTNIFFSDSVVGYTVGNMGVLKSTDSGNNWFAVYSCP